MSMRASGECSFLYCDSVAFITDNQLQVLVATESHVRYIPMVQELSQRSQGMMKDSVAALLRPVATGEVELYATSAN